LNATASAPGSFAYAPAAGTVLGAGAQTLSVTFTPSDAANYEGATASVTLNVAKAASTITWPNPAGIVYGTALGAAQLNATASVDGTFTYSPAAGTVPGAGAQTLSVTFTPADAANYQGATASVTLNVAKAATTITWPNPANIFYGTPLGAGQLNATASVSGSFAYSPAAGAVLNGGTYTLSVTFTPSDTANYLPSTASVPLLVAPVGLVIRANPASKVYGAPLPPFSVTAIGFVNGDTLASLQGSLSFTTNASAASPAGNYSILPGGVGSTNYATMFEAGPLTIAQASTTTTIVASPNPVGLNQPVTLTATVSVVAPGAGPATGYVQFQEGGTSLGMAPLANGTASIVTNGLAAGTHQISASYSGDNNFTMSFGPSSFVVNTASASSTTAVSSSSNPSLTGDVVTLTATVTPSGSSGSVAFYDGATLLGTATLSGPTARLFNVSLATGGHAITARYLGNATTPPSVSPSLAQYVRPSGANTRTSTVTLTASPSPASQGAPVSLQATVVGSQNKAPSGVVLFMVNGFVVGQATLSQTNSITAVTNLLLNALPRGTQRVEAIYLGDVTFRASRVQISLVVN